MSSWSASKIYKEADASEGLKTKNVYSWRKGECAAIDHSPKTYHLHTWGVCHTYPTTFNFSLFSR
jgi:hypothetical protein